jgi:hypothetical protein
VVLVAVRRCGLFGVLRGGGFATGMVGVRRIVGMGGVFARVLLVGQFIMTKFFVDQFFAGGLFMSLRAARLGYSRRLDR